jgi:hypothetical protein
VNCGSAIAWSPRSLNFETPEECREHDKSSAVLSFMALLENMRERAARLRWVAEMAHDPRIVEIVTRTADEIEADVRTLESGASVPVTIHLEPPQA